MMFETTAKTARSNYGLSPFSLTHCVSRRIRSWSNSSTTPSPGVCGRKRTPGTPKASGASRHPKPAACCRIAVQHVLRQQAVGLGFRAAARLLVFPAWHAHIANTIGQAQLTSRLASPLCNWHDRWSSVRYRHVLNTTTLSQPGDRQ